MARCFVPLILLALGGCGAETATTAATAGAIKQKEVEQGKMTVDASQQRVEEAARQLQQRAEQGRDAADKP